MADARLRCRRCGYVATEPGLCAGCGTEISRADGGAPDDPAARVAREVRRRKRSITTVLLGIVLPAIASGVLLLGPAARPAGSPPGEGAERGLLSVRLDTSRNVLGVLLVVGGALAGFGAQVVYLRCPSCGASLFTPLRRHWPDSCPDCGCQL